MADHHVRVILEAITKGGNNIGNFFKSNDKDIQSFRRTLRDAKKEIETFPGFGGTSTGRGEGGRFVSVEKDANRAVVALRKFRDEVKKSSAGQALGGFKSGLQEEARVREEVNKRLNISEEERIKKLDDINKKSIQRKLERINALEQTEVGEIRKVIAAEEGRAASEIRDLRSEGRILQNQIQLREKILSDKQLLSQDERKAAAAGLKDLREERDVIDGNIRAREIERDSFVDSEKRKIGAIHSRVTAEENATRDAAKRAITKASAASLTPQVREDFAKLDKDIERSDNRLRRFGLTAGRSLGQFSNGIRIGKDGLSDFEKDALRASSAAERFGARIGSATSRINPFRARTLALISVLQILGTLIVQLGAGLVALASSAIMAAAALGGALLAGVSQLLPVVGLLALAFHRLSAVINAATLADKIDLTKGEDQKTKLDQITQATQRLADARYTLKKSGESVKDSEYDLAQAQQAVKDALKDQTKAITDLAEARKQAARDIVDANFAEKDAALALQEAELGVLDAKKRLREEEQKSQLDTVNIADAQAQVKEAQARLAKARQEGDQNEIGAALQQLSQAEQDLQQIKSQADQTGASIKEARLNVQQSQLQQQEAVVRNKRAQEDAAKARKNGVEGSDQVKSAREQLVHATRAIAQAEHQQVIATRGLRDSVHGLAVARREERDAEKALTDVKTKGTAQQQQLQQALGDLSPAERKLFKSIQNIKKIYKDNFRPITDIIITAFSKAVDTIAPLLKDPKILSAAKSLATAIAGSIGKLANFTVSPEFKRFLEISLKEAAKNVPKITDGLIALFHILIRIAEAATPIFDKLLDRFVKFLEKLDKNTKDTSGLEKFFKLAGEHLDAWIDFAKALGRVLGWLIKLSAPAGKGILEDFTGALNHIADWMKANPEKVKKFFDNVRVQVHALGTALGSVAVILFKAFSSDSASQLSIFILNTVIPAFALFLDILGLIAKFFNIIFKIPIVGTFAKDILKAVFASLLFIKLGKTFLPLIKALKDGFLALKEAALLTRIQLLALAAAEKIVAVFTLIKNAIVAIGIASKAALFTPPLGVIAIIAAIVLAVVLLDRKFHFLMPTLRILLKVFQFVFNWVKDHWKLLTAIILGPFGLVIIAVAKWHDKIIGFFKAVVDWVKDHWKLIIAFFLAPFAVIILGIIKFHDKILKIIKEIPGLIVKAFEALPGLLMKIFNKIPGLLKDALKGLGGIVKSALSHIPVVGRFFGDKKSEADKFSEFISDKTLDKQDKKKAQRLHSQGLSIKEIVEKLHKNGGITDSQAAYFKFRYYQQGGSIPGGEGSAVPVIAHAGEWILNKMQQEKVARNLGMTIQQLQMNLFGTGGASTAGTKPTAKATPYSVPGKFNLVPRTDPDGIVVWFIEMADGAFGQVSARDARRIINSGGEFIPGYVRRSSHGFAGRFKSASGGFERQRGKVRHQFINPVRDRGWQGFAKGGVVSKFAGPMIQSFADGGTVLSQAGFGTPSVTNNKSIEQNFNVNTQGETDWNYVLRLGALHAQNSYT